jgi:hypothetical protein
MIRSDSRRRRLRTLGSTAALITIVVGLGGCGAGGDDKGAATTPTSNRPAVTNGSSAKPASDTKTTKSTTSDGPYSCVGSLC